MRIGISILGIIFIILGIVLISVRGIRLNFFIPIAVGIFLIVYGMIAVK